MNSASNKFLSRPGFAGDQNAGVARSDLGYAGKSTVCRDDDVPTISSNIEALAIFFPQRDVLVLQLRFGPLPLVNVG